MILHSIKYTEFKNTFREWSIEELTFDDINLIVGRNATGKSRTTNIIASLAQFVTGQRFVQHNLSTSYNAEFKENEDFYVYNLDIENGEVVTEFFSKNGDKLLSRNKGGENVIRAEKIKPGNEITFMNIQPPENEISVFARRDKIQHPFFDSLFQWGESLRYYPFGTALGQDRLFISNDFDLKVNDKDVSQVIAVFKKASDTLGDEFIQNILRDMAEVDYYLEEIKLDFSNSFQFIGTGRPTSLIVKEKGIKSEIEYLYLSAGMFRALSLIIHINYAQMTNKSLCILIDDIGEGLDFDRSKALIDLLREKAKASGGKQQLIMTSNDRFIMNKVPLKEWSVLSRKGSHIKVYNYLNSKKIFDEFEFTGLNNFDFLAMDYVNASDL